MLPYTGLPARGLALLFAQGFDGLPTGTSVSFAPVDYYGSVAYLGLFGIVLAGVALYRWRSRPIVNGLAVATLATLAITYRIAGFHPLQGLINDLHLNSVTFVRSRLPLAFLVAVMAGVGFDALLRFQDDRRARRGYWIVGALAVGVIVALDLHSALEGLPGVKSTERWQSLIWPNAMAFVVAAVGISLVWLTARRPRSRLPEQALAALLICGQSVYLVIAGAGMNIFGQRFFPQTSATRQFEARVGNNLVGLDGSNVNDVRTWTGAGFYPNVNIGYRVREFTSHDPLLPKRYFTSFPGPQGPGPSGGTVGVFTPAVTSAALARTYGISYLLARRYVWLSCGPPGAPHCIGTNRHIPWTQPILSYLNGHFRRVQAPGFLYIRERAGGAPPAPSQRATAT